MDEQNKNLSVQCPYYICDDGKHSITCEGFVQGSNVIQRYRRSQDRHTQMKVFCCRYYRNCELYRMINSEKYDM